MMPVEFSFDKRANIIGISEADDISQANNDLRITDFAFYRPYRGEKPVFVNNHAEAVMRGLG